MNKNKFLIDVAKGIHIAEAEPNDIYMLMKIPICSTRTNFNGLKFSSEFLNYAVNNIEEVKLKDMPIMAKRSKLENAQFHNLTHEFDGKTFDTDVIGVATKFFLEEKDGYEVLTCEAKIFKRFPKTIEAIKTLYNSNELEFSMEIFGTDVREVNGVKELYAGSFAGHTIVSQGAEEFCSDNEILVASHEQDLNDIKQKQGGKSSMKKIEIAGMSVDMLRQKLDSQLEYSQYEWTFDVDNSMLIVRDWEENKYYRASFAIEGDEVSVSEKDTWEEVAMVWTPITEVQETDIRVAELEAELEKSKSELESATKEVETLKAEAEVKDVSEEKTESDESIKIAELTEKLVKMTDVVETLKTEVEVLAPYKAELEKKNAEEKAERERVAKEACKELASKYFDLEDESNIHISEMVEAVDEQGIKLAIADKYIASSKIESEEDEEEAIIETAENKEYIKKPIVEWGTRN